MPSIKAIQDINTPFKLVKAELKDVEAQIRDQVRAFDPCVEPYVDYICNTNGKRIRPALAILAGGATGGVTSEHLKVGVILELIHMSTLVHDDIIDGADTRRNMPTAGAHQWTMIGLFFGSLVIAGAFTLMPGRMLNEIIFG